MSASDGSNNNKITFEEIAPDWSKRLNKLTTAKGISYEKDTMYSDISDYKKCIVGEAYGYSPSYVLYGTINHCMKCTGFSNDFAYAAKAYDSDKLIDTKQKLTEHWNKYISLLPRGYVRDAEWHKSEKKYRVEWRNNEYLEYHNAPLQLYFIFYCR